MGRKTRFVNGKDAEITQGGRAEIPFAGKSMARLIWIVVSMENYRQPAVGRSLGTGSCLDMKSPFIIYC